MSTTCNMDDKPAHCYSKFWIDLTGTCRCYPSFRAVDIIYGRSKSPQTTRVIDVPKSFSPPYDNGKESPSTLLTIVVGAWKLFLIGLELTAFSLEFLTDPEWFFFAYLTNWAMIFSIVYSTFSFLNTLIPVSPALRGNDDSKKNGVVSTRVLFTWGIFIQSAVLQMTVTVMYWFLVYEGGTPKIYTVLAHGILLVLIWIDGLVVNRIPVRLRHWLEICLPTYLIYTVWTVLASSVVFGIENPDDEEDDNIYAVLDWEESPISALIYVIAVVFGFTPICTVLLWGLSLLGRRYEEESENETRNDITDEEHEVNLESNQESVAAAVATASNHGNE